MNDVSIRPPMSADPFAATDEFTAQQVAMLIAESASERRKAVHEQKAVANQIKRQTVEEQADSIKDGANSAFAGNLGSSLLTIAGSGVGVMAGSAGMAKAMPSTGANAATQAANQSASQSLSSIGYASQGLGQGAGAMPKAVGDHAAAGDAETQKLWEAQQAGAEHIEDMETKSRDLLEQEFEAGKRAFDATQQGKHDTERNTIRNMA